jgi:hypothetical protein
VRPGICGTLGTALAELARDVLLRALVVGFVKIFSVGEYSTSCPTRLPASTLATLKNAVRSDTRAACCMLCVTMMIV